MEIRRFPRKYAVYVAIRRLHATSRIVGGTSAKKIGGACYFADSHLLLYLNYAENAQKYVALRRFTWQYAVYALLYGQKAALARKKIGGAC